MTVVCTSHEENVKITPSDNFKV